jgi:YidC/Oxa1 family membrane protein insertase
VFELISQSMIYLLDLLYSVCHNYGIAIIALTVAIRLVLWPFSKAQTKSMKMMQTLQPKMKQLQDRYKSDPQKLQGEMMKLYKEHKFNPFGGCLPLLVQIPLFLGLFWAISNPAFMAGQDPVFLKFIHLKRAGIISHAGHSDDGKMTLQEKNEGLLFGIGKDHLVAKDTIKVFLKSGNDTERKVENAATVLTILPKEPIPGEPIKIQGSYEGLGLDGYQGNVTKIQMTLENSGTREVEKIEMLPSKDGKVMQAEILTNAGKMTFNLDILILVILFVGFMWLSQKQMTGAKSADANPQQAQMMRIMQFVFIGFLFVFPLPAGVLLYMATNSVFQVVQTWWFNRDSDKTAVVDKPSDAVIDIKPSA